MYGAEPLSNGGSYGWSGNYLVEIINGVQKSITEKLHMSYYIIQLSDYVILKWNIEVLVKFS